MPEEGQQCLDLDLRGGDLANEEGNTEDNDGRVAVTTRPTPFSSWLADRQDLDSIYLYLQKIDSFYIALVKCEYLYVFLAKCRNWKKATNLAAPMAPYRCGQYVSNNNQHLKWFNLQTDDWCEILDQLNRACLTIAQSLELPINHNICQFIHEIP